MTRRGFLMTLVAAIGAKPNTVRHVDSVVRCAGIAPSRVIVQMPMDYAQHLRRLSTPIPCLAPAWTAEEEASFKRAAETYPTLPHGYRIDTFADWSVK